MILVADCSALIALATAQELAGSHLRSLQESPSCITS